MHISRYIATACIAGLGLFLSAPADSSCARGGDFTFKSHALEEGLSQGLVRCVEQDRSGFLWVGTQDGLNRFDGHGFLVFTHDPFDSTSLSHNSVTSLHADQDGNLWIGTARGLNVLLSGQMEVRCFPRNPAQSKGLEDDRITCLLRDKEGYLWVGTRDRLARVDPWTERTTIYVHDPSDSLSVCPGRVLELYEDSSGALWVGTAGGICRFDNHSGDFERYVYGATDAEGSAGAVSSILETGSGALLLATSSGLWLLDPTSGDSSPIPLQGTAAAGTEEPVRQISITDVVMDAQGRCWIATQGGIHVLSPTFEPVAVISRCRGDDSSLDYCSVNCMFRDESDVIWIGTNGYGLHSWSPYRNKFERYSQCGEGSGMRVNSVRCIYEDPTGAVWLGGYGGGLDRLDPVSHEFSNIPNPYGGPAHTILEDPDYPGELLWIGTEGNGLLHFVVRKRSFYNYPVQSAEGPGLAGRTVSSMCVGPEGNIWIGTEKGLNVFDRSNRSFSLHRFFPQGIFVRSIARDGEGSMWVGSSQGLARLDPGASEFRFYHHDYADRASLGDDEVLCVCEDSRGIIWVGTNGGGLSKLDRAKGTFTHYMQKDGLPDNVAYGILEDGEGMLWISTNAGLSRFDPRIETFRNYDVDDGLQSAEFNANAYHKGRSGALYFGGISGFNVIRPDLLKDDPHQPRVVLTDFMLFNKPVRAGVMDDGRTLLERNISQTNHIVLSHRDRVLSFELAAMNFTVPSHNTFAYKLEGLDEDWNYIGSRRHITFTDLDPGIYRLKLKAANSDGIWGEEVTSLEMVVEPPLWMTWWFRGSALLALAVLAIGLHRARTSGIRRRTAKLDASKQFLDSMINAIDDPVLVKDEGHRWVVLNDKACEMMGLPREKLIGKTEHDLLPSDQADALWKADEDAFSSGGTVVNEDIVDLSGERRVFSTKNSVFTEEATGSRFIASTVRDITDLKRYECAMEDRLHFESLVSRISAQLINPPASEIDVVIEDGLREIGEFFGADRVVIRLMKGEENIPAKVYVWRADGVSRSQVRMDFEDAFPNLAGELRRDCELVFERIEEIPASWVPEHNHMAETGIKSGVVVPLSVGGSLLGSISVLMIGVERAWGSEVVPRVRILGETLANALNRKRTEETFRQSQQKYWSILENVGLGIALVSRDMEVLELNKKMREWFPGDRCGDAGHAHIACADPSRSRDCPECPTALTLRDGRVHESVSSMVVDGRSVKFRIASSPILDSNGEIVAAIELVEDVTEKQRLEEQLRHSQKMKAIGTLAGGIAHDFNNILYAILGYASLAKAYTSSGTPIVDCLEQIEAAGHRAADLVEQILGLGRRSESTIKPLHLQESIVEAMKLLRGSLPATVEIRQHLSNSCGAVMGDSTQIHQLLINLCTNAFQAMPNHKGVLDVGLDEIEIEEGLTTRFNELAPGRYVRLVVRDDGVGMDGETVKRIFEPYFTTKEQGEGSGLGLAMVHGIVKNHAGAIRVDSKPGCGTTFEVYFPLCREAVDDTGAKAPERNYRPVLASVLFVDDEHVIADMCERILSSIGHRVSKYTDSVKAVKAFRADPHAYDLIITDVTMPGLTGFDLADEVRAVRGDIPIILCTGYSESLDTRAIAELNIQKCVWKPLDYQDLARAVQEVLAVPGMTEV